MVSLALVDSRTASATATGGGGGLGAVGVVVAHGDSLARIGLEALLADAPGITVVGCAADGEAAVALAGAVRPDVVSSTSRCPALTASR